jgi:hypothetical protein
MRITGDGNEFQNNIDVLRSHIRLIVLLDSAEKAGLTPLPILRLHIYAYLSNVLSPVWDMPAPEGKILKRRGSPFYPVLQNSLDLLVGMGVVNISGVSHVLDEEQRWRLEGAYQLNRQFADRILHRIMEFESEHRLLRYLQELAYALSALGDDDFTVATKEDATYSDPVIDVGNVVDFAEWQHVNYSANAARFFARILPSGTRTTSGEMLHLYVNHMYRRLHDGH